MGLSFVAHVEVLPVDERGLIAIAEQGCDVYQGASFAKLGTLIDGSRDEAEILAACDDDERDAVAAALGDLRGAALLTAAPSENSSADAPWWSSQKIPPALAATRIRAASVQVHALGQVDPALTIAALADAQLGTSADAKLTIVLCEDYLDDALAELNALSLREDRSWMLAQPGGARILVGPVFRPARGPCWECLAHRLRHNRFTEERVRALAKSSRPLPRSQTPDSLRGLGPALVATEAMRWLAGARPGFESLVLSFDTRTWESGSHRLMRRPQCPACGESEASLRGTSPIRIGRPSTGRASAVGLRTVSPETTLERFAHHVGAVTGVVPTLSKVPGPEALHAYVAGGPGARVHGEHGEWEYLASSLSSGKGTTDGEARTSALCEALERYSGRFSGGEPRRSGTFEELAPLAIDPNDYMRFSVAQYAERERWNARARSFRSHVPEPFDPRERIDWSPVWSITRERERLLPTSLCYYGADVPGYRVCVAESNGNAAGNTIEEAILHGLLELIERDHVALWWYNRLPAPAVDLDSLDDPWLSELGAQIAGEGRDFWALDLTADLGIPAAAALVASTDGGGVGMGFGAHPDLGRAVVRAATELVQLGLGGHSGGLGAGTDRTLHLDQHPFLKPNPESRPRVWSVERGFSGDVSAALALCRTAIEQQQIEVLVLDQTRPDIGLPVVKVLAPGLRHFWPRFGSGRLYEVPVKLGLLEHPREEHELNQIPPVS